MFPLNPIYFRPAGFTQIPTDDSVHLSVDGRVRPLTPFQWPPGDPSLPGLSPYGDEKTGNFSDGTARLGTALFGQRRYVQCDAGIEVWDVNGNLVGLMGPQDVLATTDVDVKAGLALAVPSGIHPSLTVTLAGPGTKSPIGIAGWNVISGFPVLVRCGGIFSLPNWTAATGGVSLAFDDYYLAANGTWSNYDSGGLAHLATRLGPQTVKIRC